MGFEDEAEQSNGRPYRQVAAVLLPRQQSKLARGAKDEEHVMSQNLSRVIAVIGIDIGNRAASEVVAWPS